MSFLEAFDGARREAERLAFIGVVDPEAAVLGLELVGDLVENVPGLAEHHGGAFAAAIGASEHPCPSAEGDAAQLPLGGIVRQTAGHLRNPLSSRL
jgi:hypothetical protein